MKVILIKDCADCPLSEIVGMVVECHSAKWSEPRKVGKLNEVVVKRIIPEWCPLTDAEELIKNNKKEIKIES